MSNCESPTDGMSRGGGRDGSGSANKKRTGAGSSGAQGGMSGALVKGNKPRLKTMGSSSSVEGGNSSSGFISRGKCFFLH